MWHFDQTIANISMKHPTRLVRIFMIVLLLLTGINALIAGFLFIIDPSGKMMGMTPDYIASSPFSNFLIPGIVLFTVNGVLNVVAAIATIKKTKYHPLLIIFQGAALAGWILIQVWMVKDFNALHGVMLTIGILLLLGGFFLQKKLQQP